MIARRVVIPLVLVLSAGLLCAGLAQAPVLAQDETPLPSTEMSRRPLQYDILPALPRLAGAAAPGPSQVTPASDLASWSQLVFQTARNGQDWEVYGAAGDGSEQINLSNSPKMDQQPRLNRGATRVIFTSRHAENYDIYVMNADGSSLTRLTTHEKEDIYPAWSPDGSRIVFQSYRDGQAELYVMNADGSSQARLTAYDDYDGEPAWSPDGSQIAFTRQNSGQYRIWVMNADGSNPHQLSAQSYSENPAWSPAGSQIAYDADGNGDGWQEIWLMDADGGNQHQIYDPYESYTDAWVRSWSPDGRYIAFTRISFTQHQGNWYWTTAYLDAWNSSGGSITRLSSNGEDWLPDWQTADAQAPTSSVQALPAQSPGPFTVSWSGTDPGSAGIASYDVQVMDDAAGAWTDWQMETTENSASYPGYGGHTYDFRVRARDNAGNVESWPATSQAFTTVESTPPRSAVLPLPAYTWVGSATMTWDGQDYGGSDVQTFELQCRDGAAGVWQSCGTYSAPGSATIPGQPSHTIYIRSRAIDSATNVEAWPPGDGDTHTTIYTAKVSGSVRDTVGTPIIGVTVNMTPTNFVTISDASDGSYEAYASEEAANIQAALSKVGYGSLPATTLTGWPSATLDGILPPADNQVRNWGFEEELSPAWETGGSAIPVLANWATHTGQHSVALGWPFTQLANISNLSGFSRLLAACGDDTGGLHVAWRENDLGGTGLGLRYAQRSADGIWSAPETLPGSSNASGMQLAVGQDGTVYIVWADYYLSLLDVFLIRKTPAGEWSAVENVSRSSTIGSSLRWMGLDSNDTLHVVWSEGVDSEHMQIYYAQRTASGIWSTPTRVSNAGTYGTSSGSAIVAPDGEMETAWIEQKGVYPTIFYAHRNTEGVWSAPQQLFRGSAPILLLDSGGVLHMVWGNGGSMLYANRPPAGAWSASETLIQGEWEYWVRGMQVAIDNLDVLHAVATCGDDIWYLRRDASNTWSEAELIATTDSPQDIRMTLDANRTIYTIWRSSWDGYRYRSMSFARRSASEEWSAPLEIAAYTTQALPQLICGGHERLHLVWSADNSAGSDVVHTLYTGTPPAGDSWLRQVLTIPSTTVNPGLSFLYRLQQGNPDGRNPFSITVQDEANLSSVFQTSAVASDWTHDRIDLAPWRGKGITLTFDLHNEADNSPSVVFLDEVTIGSAHPDTWIGLAGRSAAPPDAQFEQTITYGNRGGVTADNGYVTLLLPAELTFVSAAPPPSATAPELRWNVGNLAAGSSSGEIFVTLQVATSADYGMTVTTTAAITSDTPEVEQVNNTAQAATFVGHRIYLPITPLEAE